MQSQPQPPQQQLAELAGSDTQLRHRHSTHSTHSQHERAPIGAHSNDSSFEAPLTFFQVGRDFEASDVTHKFTAKEMHTMAREFESLDYRDPSNAVHTRHLEAQAAGVSDTKKWIAFAVIGVLVGLVAFFLKQTIEYLAHAREREVERLVREDRITAAYSFFVFHSLGLVALAVLPVYIKPNAAGSGVPEVMAFLNGVLIKSVFNVRTAVAKFFSAAGAVASGLPVGPEGPMIHMGASIGAGVSQGRSKTLGFSTPFFSEFRNPRDKRDFITGGAAAGFSAAFGAPVGGLLFAMEEVSSFWQQKLTWMIFFGTMMSTFVVNLLASSFEDFKYRNTFGFWDDDATILFHVDAVVRFNVAAIPAVAVIGVLGGVLGAAFTFINLKVNRARRRFFSQERLDRGYVRIWKIAEPFAIMFVFGTIAFLIPRLFDCKDELSTPLTSEHADASGAVPFKLRNHQFTCGEGRYNPAATLFHSGGDTVIRHLLSRGTSWEFGYGPVVALLFIYFVFACYSAGTAISSGIVVPMLLIGACLGRLIGLASLDLFGEAHDWNDPGVFAFVGAAAFFGGVSRLTISLSVCMVEISNDIRLLLPVMLAIMIAKRVADSVTHSLYHALLEMKCIPFLDQTSIVPKLECFHAADIMHHPVLAVGMRVRVRELVRLLNYTGTHKRRHNAFPVVTSTGIIVPDTRAAQEASPDDSLPGPSLPLEISSPQLHHASALGLNVVAETQPGERHLYQFKGIILRSQLEHVLQHSEYFFSDPRGMPLEPITHDKIVQDEDALYARHGRRPDELTIAQEDLDKFVDLAPLVDNSSFCLHYGFSLRLCYEIFRAMGLRHLVVVNDFREVCGIITRKDLLGQMIETRIEQIMAARSQARE